MLCRTRALTAVGRTSATTRKVVPRQIHTVVHRNVGSQLVRDTQCGTTRRWYAAGDRHLVQVPGLGDSISEGTILEWLIPEGGKVNAHDTVVSLETDKVTQPVHAPVSGTVVKHLSPLGTDVRVGDVVFELIEGEGAEAKVPETKAPEVKADKPKPQETKAAPKAKETPKPAPAAKSATSAAPVSAPQPGFRSEQRVKMSKMRLRIAQRLKDSQNTAAMLTTFNEIDMENLINMRNKHKDAFEKKHGVKLGFMSAFVKASSAALAEFPSVNGVIDEDHIIFRDYHDISVAVASPTGLVVPVLRNVETMGFADIEKKIGHFGGQARDGSLALEDMQGGTFTVSNGGVYGSMMGTPIINPPQSAILGMHGTTKRAVVIDNEIKIRPIMYVALTYDHRIIDGREAVLFLRKIKAIIEDPQVLLLDL